MHTHHRARGPGFAQREVLTLGLLYEMVLKKKKQIHPVRQTESEERESKPWQVESIIIHKADERKEHNK